MQSFNEQQISAILRRAAELQAGDETTAPGLTLDELRSIAAEVGIDPRFVEQAALEARRPAQQKAGFPVFGTPARLSEERVMTQAVDEDAWSEMVEELRRTYGQVGTVTGAGNTRTWSFGDRRSPSAATVSITQRRGRTFLTAQRNLHRELGVTFGPSSGPLMVFVVLLATGQLFPGLALGFNLLAAAVLLLTGFFALRAVAGHIGGKERRKMSDLLDRLEVIAEERGPSTEAREVLPEPPVGRAASPLLDLDPGDASEAAPETAPTARRTRLR